MGALDSSDDSQRQCFGWRLEAETEEEVGGATVAAQLVVGRGSSSTAQRCTTYLQRWRKLNVGEKWNCEGREPTKEPHHLTN